MGKVVFSVASYWPLVDGVQKVTSYQAEGLVKLGHDVVVLTSDFHSFAKVEKHNGVMIKRLPVYKSGGWVKGNRNSVKEMVDLECRDADVFVCVCPSEALNQWILPIVAGKKIKKIGIMHGIHDFSYNAEDRKSAKTFLIKMIRNCWWNYFWIKNWKYVKSFDKVTHLHEEENSIKFFEMKGYKKNVVLYNGVEEDFFRIESNSKKNRVINVSTFFPRKNQKKALDVFFQADLPGWELILIGPKKTDYYYQIIEHLEKLEKEYGQRNVKILCGVEREETIKYIKEAAIYLLTSSWEAFPVSVIEAMATGAAFLSTDVGVVKYWPGGIVCLDEGEMVNQLRLLTDNWSVLGLKAREYATQNFCYAELIAKFERILFE